MLLVIIYVLWGRSPRKLSLNTWNHIPHPGILFLKFHN